MSADLKLQLDPPRVSPPNRGPATGRGLTDAEFLQLHASPNELAAFKKAVEERLAKDGGSWEFWRCDHCRTVLKDRPGAPEGSPCPRCNFMRRTDGGRLRLMTEAEANAWLFEEAKREKAAIERDRERVFIAANAERARNGLAPLSRAEYTARAKAEFELLKQRGRDLAQAATACRRQP